MLLEAILFFDEKQAISYPCFQVTDALKKSGLESSNLILGIDFTKSDEWIGRSI